MSDKKNHNCRLRSNYLEVLYIRLLLFFYFFYFFRGVSSSSCTTFYSMCRCPDFIFFFPFFHQLDRVCVKIATKRRPSSPCDIYFANDYSVVLLAIAMPRKYLDNVSGNWSEILPIVTLRYLFRKRLLVVLSHGCAAKIIDQLLGNCSEIPPIVPYR